MHVWMAAHMIYTRMYASVYMYVWGVCVWIHPCITHVFTCVCTCIPRSRISITTGQVTHNQHARVYAAYAITYVVMLRAHDHIHDYIPADFLIGNAKHAMLRKLRQFM